MLCTGGMFPPVPCFEHFFPQKIVMNLLVHQTNILKLGILIKRKGKKGANPNAEPKTTTQNPPGTHSTSAKYVIDI